MRGALLPASQVCRQIIPLNSPPLRFAHFPSYCPNVALLRMLFSNWAPCIARKRVGASAEQVGGGHVSSNQATEQSGSSVGGASSYEVLMHCYLRSAKKGRHGHVCARCMHITGLAASPAAAPPAAAPPAAAQSAASPPAPAAVPHLQIGPIKGGRKGVHVSEVSAPHLCALSAGPSKLAAHQLAAREVAALLETRKEEGVCTVRLQHDSSRAAATGLGNSSR